MTTAQNSGIGVFGGLGVLFVALKLTGYVGWPWALVTLPFWVLPGALMVSVVAATILVAATKAYYWISK